jgi:diguanylate cyclase (GGDEF)-like protein/PAS domain S-box-containing protein
VTSRRRPRASETSQNELRRELDEARETLSAIQNGEVDALIINAGQGDEVFTLSGADRPYRLIVEGMTEGTITVSDAGTILYVNARMCEILGVSSGDLVGSDAGLLVGTESQTVWTAMIHGDAVRVPAVRLALRMGNHAGTVPVRVSSSRFDLDGHHTTCLVVADISAEERADEALRFQSQLLEAAGEAIIASDPSGFILYANRAAEDLYGWPHHEMIGRALNETTVAEQVAERAKEIMKQMNRGHNWSGEFVVKRRDGARFSAHVTSTPVQSPDGKLAAIISISTDVTERVEAERILRLQADISERIAADAPVADVLDSIGEIAAGLVPGTSVSFRFDHPQFRYDTITHQRGAREEQTRILVENGAVGLMVIRRTAAAKARAPFSALRASRAAHLAALVAQREISKARLSSQALHDPLTGLANRTLLADRIARALTASNAPVTLLVGGVDNFKRSNDALGHEIGDRVLNCLASRFASAIELDDTLARFGGDEFAILIDHPATDLSAVGLAERLLRIAQEPILIGDNDLRMTMSIGIAARAGVGDTPTGLMASAGGALSDAKRAGRNRISMSGIDSRHRVEDRLRMEQELRVGLPRGELVGYMQPVVNFASGAVDGAEMLVRWQHPTRGLLQPGEFVPWAEETDLIHAIGAAMLEAACIHLATLDPADHFVVSINAAAREITNPGYAERTLHALRRHRLAGSVLGVELTESVAIAQMDAVLANLTALRAAGVTIYLDDFGTGYSSLGYLRQLPVDVLKIDRSFVTTMTTDPKAAEVVAAVGAMARALSLSTVAEGVETAAQAEALTALGIDRGQGYLYAKPLPTDAFSTWLEKHSSIARGRVEERRTGRTARDKEGGKAA